MAFLPFTWGLGLVSAAAVVTFRRGASATAMVVTMLGLLSGAVFPIALLPGFLQTHRGVEPVRDRDRWRPRRADRRHGLGRSRRETCRGWSRSRRARPGARCALLPRRGRARAAPRDVGALLMESVLWERVGELADRAPRISDLRHHKLHLLAAVTHARSAAMTFPPSCGTQSVTRPRSRWAPAAAAPHPRGDGRPDYRHEGRGGR